MLTLVCLSANAVPESDEVRALTGKAAFALSSDEPPVVLLDAWDAAGNLAPGWTWNNVNDWAAREMAPNRRLDAILVGEPCVGGRGQVLKAELFADDVVLKSCLGAMPSAMWPRSVSLVPFSCVLQLRIDMLRDSPRPHLSTATLPHCQRAATP